MPTRLSDVIVPEVFTPYMMQRTMELSEIVQSGAMAPDQLLNELLAGAGLTFHVPSYKDLPNDAANISSDNAAAATAKKIQAMQEIAVRISRNQMWGTADLVSDLIGNDPQDTIKNRVADYWKRELQRTTVATIQGVYADNSAAPSGDDTHT